MKVFWKLVAFALGLGLVQHGYNVTQNGILVHAKFQGGFQVDVGEAAALPMGLMLVGAGFYVFYMLLSEIIKERRAD